MILQRFLHIFSNIKKQRDWLAIICIVTRKADLIEKIGMNEPFEVQVKH